jgi:hypothetical protein
MLATSLAAGLLALCVAPLAAAPIDGLESDAAAPAFRPPPPDDVIPEEALRRDYIVVLEAPPLASYRGGIEGIPATSPVALGEIHVDVDRPAARAYLEWLDGQRDAAIQRLMAVAPTAEIGWQYRIVLNGFSVTMQPEEAMALIEQPGVLVVHPAEELELEMDAANDLMETALAWEAAGGVISAGLGARIGILDTGGEPNHPWFSDEGMPEAPDGYPSATMHGRDGTVLPYPEPELFVNDKLIAGRVFVRNATTQSLGSSMPLISCGSNGNPCSDHGLHVGGIAAGRYGQGAVDFGTNVVTVTLGGVAPMAHVLAYRNYDSTPGMVAALEQAALDEVDAINASLGQSGWLTQRPESHPISIAAAGAADAGTLFVASAGNAGGNGEPSLSGGWKYSDRLMTVGNSSANKSFDRVMTVEGEGVPDEAARLLAAPRGTQIFITETLSGPLYLSPDGGCSEDPEAADKVVVINRWNTGGCGYTARATNLNNAGALAIIYYYDDRYLGGYSGTNLAMFSVAVGQSGGTALLDFLAAGGEATVTIEPEVVRHSEMVPDLKSASSSMGPGLDWGIKPDVSAPGTSILSSVASLDGEGNRVYDIGTKSGTSMASPQVTGAGGLLRSLHPDWTVDQLRSAIINTSRNAIVVTNEDEDEGAELFRPARPPEGGAGRMHVGAAWMPGAFLYPPTLNFGRMKVDETKTITVTVESELAADSGDAQWQVRPTPLTGDGAAAPAMRSISVEPGMTTTLAVTFDASATTEVEHWGDVVLELEGDGRTLRLPYYAYVDRPENRRDVMIIDWAYGDGPDHTAAYTDTLEKLGLTYTVYVLDEDHPDAQERHPSLELMLRHDLVILNSNESRVSLQQRLAGQYQYQNLFLAGGAMLIAGQGTPNFWRYLNTGTRLGDTANNRNNYPDTWPHVWSANSQNGGCEMCLGRYFAGFTYEYTATLSGRHLIPFPTAALTPERKVILPPHDEAEGLFDYAVDLSTGGEASEGALGNQYTFASGDIVRGYQPTTNARLTAQLGDISYAETTLGPLVELVRPLWSYTGEFLTDEGAIEEQTKVVGSYVAGRHYPGEGVGWNAMFWGFGLEGVGYGSPEGVNRDRLLGDVFNFLGQDLVGVSIDVRQANALATELGILIPDLARIDPEIDRVSIDWGDGASEPEVITYDPPVPASELSLEHVYGATGAFSVSLIAEPVAHAAPLYLETVLEVSAPPTIYLPLTLADHALGEVDSPEPLADGARAALVPAKDGRALDARSPSAIWTRLASWWSRVLSD